MYTASPLTGGTRRAKMEFGLLIHIRVYLCTWNEVGICTHFLVVYVWIFWACRSHLTLGVLQHVLEVEMLHIRTRSSNCTKYYTLHEDMEETYREQKEGRFLHSQFSLRPYST